MKKSLRTEVALASFAICWASVGTYGWLFVSYYYSRPTTPDATLGFVHALNVHGSPVYVYISDTDLTGLALLRTTFILGLIGAFVLFPKDPTLAPPGTARWLTRFYVAKAELVNPTSRQKANFLCSILVYVALVWLAGPAIVRLILSSGIGFLP